MKGVSIIICCYNSVNRLKPTLEHIVKQEVSKNIPWEVVVVDNNSDDGTAKYAEQIWKSLDCNVPFRIIFEPKSGLSFAREKGIYTAQYEYILFCDDDNWLNDNYIQRVFNIFEQEDNIAAIGGIGEAVCEIQPPKWFVQLKGSYYACGKIHKESGRIKSKNGTVYGAGMAIKKSIFIKMLHSGFQFSLTGRSGKKQLMGEELEMGLMFKILGHDIWYDTSLTFKHFIPKEKLEWKVYKSLRNNYGRATASLFPYYHELLGYSSSKTFYILWLLKLITITPFIYLKQFIIGDFRIRQATLTQIIAIFVVYKFNYSYLEKRQEIENIKKSYLKNKK